MDSIIILLVLCIVLCSIYILQPEKEPKREVDIVRPVIVTESEESAQLTESYLTLDNYIGQGNGIKYLKIHIKNSKKIGKPLPHIVLWGSGGLGKSTLMKATAQEMGGKFIEIVPANLRSINDLFGIVFKKQCVCGYLNHYSSTKCKYCKVNIKEDFYPAITLKDNDIIFLEECHRLKVDIEEAMYSLMQDGYMMVRYYGEDKKVKFPKITIAGATTRLGDLNKPFRDRFKLNIQLVPYSEESIKIISRMYAEHIGLSIDDNALTLVASVSFGIPRIAKKYIEDAGAMADEINIQTVGTVLKLLEVDKNGLDSINRKILKYIHIRGQAGHTAIASSCGITSNIYLEVYEPALLYNNFIFQGSRGRELTENAKKEYFKGCKCKKCTK